MQQQIERKPIMKKKPSGKFKVQWFQREDLARLNEQRSSANWSEMGAMKTTTAEWLWAQKLKHVPNPRVLVITTKTGKGTYFESLWETLPEWDVFTIDTTKTRLALNGKPIPINVALPNPLYFRPVVAVAHYHCFSDRSFVPRQRKDRDGIPLMNPNGTFKMIVPKCALLAQYPWDMIIVDEAHRMKNPDTQWTRNIKKLTTEFKHIMTGTGFVNNPAEIWSLLNFLYPETYTSYWNFRKHYCEEEEVGGYKKIVGIKADKEQEFKELVRTVGVRRTMVECFPDIDEPIETVVPMELNKRQRLMYDEMLNDLRTLDAKGEPLHSPTVLSMLNRLRQICVATPDVIGDEYDPILDKRVIKIRLIEPSSKLDSAMEIIDGLEWDAERKDQIVIFSNFKDPLKLMEARLTRAKIPYLRLLSEMNEQKRYELWHDVWPKKEHQVFLSTLALGAESINLACANRAIFLDQSWSPVQNTQARGRIYRPGQKGVAQFIYVRADNTVDYRVLDANIKKEGWFKQIFGETDEGEDDDENGS